MKYDDIIKDLKLKIDEIKVFFKFEELNSELKDKISLSETSEFWSGGYEVDSILKRIKYLKSIICDIENLLDKFGDVELVFMLFMMLSIKVPVPQQGSIILLSAEKLYSSENLFCRIGEVFAGILFFHSLFESAYPAENREVCIYTACVAQLCSLAY